MKKVPPGFRTIGVICIVFAITWIGFGPIGEVSAIRTNAIDDSRFAISFALCIALLTGGGLLLSSTESCLRAAVWILPAAGIVLMWRACDYTSETLDDVAPEESLAILAIFIAPSAVLSVVMIVTGFRLNRLLGPAQRHSPSACEATSS